MYLALDSIIIKCLHASFWVCSVWSLLSFENVHNHAFHKSGKYFQAMCLLLLSPLLDLPLCTWGGVCPAPSPNCTLCFFLFLTILFSLFSWCLFNGSALHNLGFFLLPIQVSFGTLPVRFLIHFQNCILGLLHGFCFLLTLGFCSHIFYPPFPHFLFVVHTVEVAVLNHLSGKYTIWSLSRIVFVGFSYFPGSILLFGMPCHLSLQTEHLNVVIIATFLTKNTVLALEINLVGILFNLAI